MIPLWVETKKTDDPDFLFNSFKDSYEIKNVLVGFEISFTPEQTFLFL